jgi:hypothetical protein
MDEAAIAVAASYVEGVLIAEELTDPAIVSQRAAETAAGIVSLPDNSDPQAFITGLLPIIMKQKNGLYRSLEKYVVKYADTTLTPVEVLREIIADNTKE